MFFSDVRNALPSVECFAEGGNALFCGWECSVQRVRMVSDLFYCRKHHIIMLCI
jgi:hypothetical protein